MIDVEYRYRFSNYTQKIHFKNDIIQIPKKYFEIRHTYRNTAQGSFYLQYIYIYFCISGGGLDSVQIY